LSMGNHELYMRRRKPDTIEVQQMKAQAMEEKTAKKVEREKLKKEVVAREEAERKQQEYAEKLRKMQEDMERRQKELQDAQETIKKLEEQLVLVQKAKDEYEKKQMELEEMMIRLENEKHMEAEEKIKLEEEIKMKQEEVHLIRKEVEEKDMETKKLQEEVEEARKKQQEVAEALLAASTTPSHIHVKESEHDEDDVATLNGDYGADLSNCSDENVPRPEEERSTEVSKKKALGDQLQMLSEELSNLKDDSKLTKNDLLHQENVRHGRDKYKTLREIRQGNTKRRVDQFENM